MAAAAARDPTGYDAPFVNDAADGLDASFEFEAASGSTRLERHSPSLAPDYSRRLRQVITGTVGKRWDCITSADEVNQS
jgi:hypothetical protein